MSITKIEKYNTTERNLDKCMLFSACSIYGYYAIEVSDPLLFAQPYILAGGKIEIGGSFYSVNSDTTLTDPVSNGVYYIMFDVTQSESPIPVFTTTAPVWNDIYSGWYGTNEYSMCRYANVIYTKTGSSWFPYAKRKLTEQGSVFNTVYTSKFNSRNGFIIEKTNTDSFEAYWVPVHNSEFGIIGWESEWPHTYTYYSIPKGTINGYVYWVQGNVYAYITGPEDIG